jgi:hypothetical protein
MFFLHDFGPESKEYQARSTPGCLLCFGPEFQFLCLVWLVYGDFLFVKDEGSDERQFFSYFCKQRRSLFLFIVPLLTKSIVFSGYFQGFRFGIAFFTAMA